MTKPPIALEDRHDEDGRLFSPSAGRNKTIIADMIAEQLPRNAHVLEIASGTGEHGAEMLSHRPDLHWQFSDPDSDSRASQSAWIRHLKLPLPVPIEIDTTRSDWTKPLSQYDAIFCANMIHIAPWEATTGLAEGAASLLTESGEVFLYGPFCFGDETAPSNLQFDLNLKARNSAWGVRELESVKHIFAKQGFNHAELRDMPANNHILRFSRRET